jgi:hypothetical protein
MTTVDGFFKCTRSYLIYIPNVDQFYHLQYLTKLEELFHPEDMPSFSDAYFSRSSGIGKTPC